LLWLVVREKQTGADRYTAASQDYYSNGTEISIITVCISSQWTTLITPHIHMICKRCFDSSRLDHATAVNVVDCHHRMLKPNTFHNNFAEIWQEKLHWRDQQKVKMFDRTQEFQILTANKPTFCPCYLQWKQLCQNQTPAGNRKYSFKSVRKSWQTGQNTAGCRQRADYTVPINEQKQSQIMQSRDGGVCADCVSQWARRRSGVVVRCDGQVSHQYCSLHGARCYTQRTVFALFTSPTPSNSSFNPIKHCMLVEFRFLVFVVLITEFLW